MSTRPASSALADQIRTLRLVRFGMRLWQEGRWRRWRPPAWLKAALLWADRAVGGRARLAFSAARRAWRRSLQLRVISITLLLSGLLVGAFGLVVANTITQGILTSKQKSARAQVDSGGKYTLTQLGTILDPEDSNLNATVLEVLQGLASTRV